MGSLGTAVLLCLVAFAGRAEALSSSDMFDKWLLDEAATCEEISSAIAAGSSLAPEQYWFAGLCTGMLEESRADQVDAHLSQLQTGSIQQKLADAAKHRLRNDLVKAEVVLRSIPVGEQSESPVVSILLARLLSLEGKTSEGLEIVNRMRTQDRDSRFFAITYGALELDRVLRSKKDDCNMTILVTRALDEIESSSSSYDRGSFFESTESFLHLDEDRIEAAFVAAASLIEKGGATTDVSAVWAMNFTLDGIPRNDQQVQASRCIHLRMALEAHLYSMAIELICRHAASLKASNNIDEARKLIVRLKDVNRNAASKIEGLGHLKLLSLLGDEAQLIDLTEAKQLFSKGLEIAKAGGSPLFTGHFYERMADIEQNPYVRMLGYQECVNSYGFGEPINRARCQFKSINALWAQNSRVKQEEIGTWFVRLDGARATFRRNGESCLFLEANISIAKLLFWSVVEDDSDHAKGLLDETAKSMRTESFCRMPELFVQSRFEPNSEGRLQGKSLEWSQAALDRASSLWDAAGKTDYSIQVDLMSAILMHGRSTRVYGKLRKQYKQRVDHLLEKASSFGNLDLLGYVRIEALATSTYMSDKNALQLAEQVAFDFKDANKDIYLRALVYLFENNDELLKRSVADQIQAVVENSPIDSFLAERIKDQLSLLNSDIVPADHPLRARVGAPSTSDDGLATLVPAPTRGQAKESGSISDCAPFNPPNLEYLADRLLRLGHAQAAEVLLDEPRNQRASGTHTLQGSALFKCLKKYVTTEDLNRIDLNYRQHGHFDGDTGLRCIANIRSAAANRKFSSLFLRLDDCELKPEAVAIWPTRSQFAVVAVAPFNYETHSALALARAAADRAIRSSKTKIEFSDKLLAIDFSSDSASADNLELLRSIPDEIRLSILLQYGLSSRKAERKKKFLELATPIANSSDSKELKFLHSLLVTEVASALAKDDSEIESLQRATRGRALEWLDSSPASWERALTLNSVRSSESSLWEIPYRSNVQADLGKPDAQLSFELTDVDQVDRLWFWSYWVNRSLDKNPIDAAHENLILAKHRLGTNRPSATDDWSITNQKELISQLELARSAVILNAGSSYQASPPDRISALEHARKHGPVLYVSDYHVILINSDGTTAISDEGNIATDGEEIRDLLANNLPVPVDLRERGFQGVFGLLDGRVQDGSRLTIVSSISGIPFGAMKDANGRYAAQRWIISTTPSLTLLRQLESTIGKYATGQHRLSILKGAGDSQLSVSFIDDMQALYGAGEVCVEVTSADAFHRCNGADTIIAANAMSGDESVFPQDELPLELGIEVSGSPGSYSMMSGMEIASHIGSLGHVTLIVCDAASTNLDRLFFIGGARSVLSSAWKLPQGRQTEYFVASFMEAYRRDPSVGRDAALALAQNLAIKAGVPTSVWAGWSLVGLRD